MTTYLRELYDARDLLVIWIQREIKAKYTGSYLGFAWAILQPLAVMVIFTLVFSVILRVPTEGVPYSVYLFAGLSPWLFFNGTISSSTNALLGNIQLAKKVYFPREIFPLGALAANSIDFIITMVLFVVLLLIAQVPLYATLLYYPVILLVQLVLMIGLSLMISAAVVFLRDLRFIVPLALQLGMYVTPVFYPLSNVPPSVLPFYMLNPMASIIDAYRRISLYGQPPEWGYLAYAAGFAVVTLIVGYLVFKRSERSFVDLS